MKSLQQLTRSTLATLLVAGSVLATLRAFSQTNEVFHGTLLGYYDLDNNGSLGQDRTPLGNNGSVGGSLITVPDRHSNSNLACRFDGSSGSYISATGASIYPYLEPAISVSFRFKPSTTAPGYPDNRCLFQLIDGSNPSTCHTYDVFYNFSTEEILMGNWNAGSSAVYQYSNNAYTANGTWHSVVVVFEPGAGGTGTVTLWVDGAMDGSFYTGTLVPPGQSDLWIGAHAINNWNFSGDIDEFRVHGKALTSNEVAALHGDHLRAYYTMNNDYSSYDAADESGHENLGTSGAGVASFATDANGNSTEALAFDGTSSARSEVDEHASINTDQMTSNQLSMSVWVYPDAQGSGTKSVYQIIDPMTNTTLELLYDYTSNKFVVVNTASKGLGYGFAYSTTNTYGTGSWHHVVVESEWSLVNDKSTVYVDNSIDGITTLGAYYDVPVEPKIYIGDQISGGANFFGYIDGLRMYDYKLTGTEVSTLYGLTYKKRGTTGVSQASVVEDVISIYPNPAKDRIAINYGGVFKHDMDVTIMNTMGQQVLSTTVKNGGISAGLDISMLTPGIYFMEITERGTAVKVQKKFRVE